MVISVLTTALLMQFIFGNIPVAGLVIAALVPILAGLPIIIIIDRQRRKLNEALAELKQAHSQLESLNAELEKQARYDYMTGFLNRRYFVEAVGTCAHQGGNGAMLCIDVDNFKQINDSFGHLVGDDALRLIARTISSATRDGDLIARMGGEEFAIFLRNVDFKGAFKAAEQVRMAIEATPFEPTEGVRHDLSVSIGVALSGETKDFKTLFGQADMRMYTAKQQGKNRTISPDINHLGQVA
jgi:diguanylate cyclase (GGDEF)-like protein